MRKCNSSCDFRQQLATLLSLGGLPKLMESLVCEFKLLICTAYIVFTFRPLKSMKSEETTGNNRNSSVKQQSKSETVENI